MKLIVTLCALVEPGADPAPCERHAAPLETVAFCPPPTPAVVRPGWRIAEWRCEQADGARPPASPPPPRR